MDEKTEGFSWSGYALLQHCARDVKVDQNVVLSPASVYAAMTMAGVRAVGKTMGEFERVFGKDFKQHAKSNASVFATIHGQVTIANAIFLREIVRSEFNELIVKDIDPQISQDRSKEFINSRCAENTNGMIKEILIEELDLLIQAVILSVVYLKAK